MIGVSIEDFWCNLPPKTRFLEKIWSIFIRTCPKVQLFISFGQKLILGGEGLIYTPFSTYYLYVFQVSVQASYDLTLATCELQIRTALRVSEITNK